MVVLFLQISTPLTKQARFSLQVALGLSISEGLFTSPYNLVVEGSGGLLVACDDGEDSSR